MELPIIGAGENKARCIRIHSREVNSPLDLLTPEAAKNRRPSTARFHVWVKRYIFTALDTTIWRMVAHTFSGSIRRICAIIERFPNENREETIAIGRGSGEQE